MTTPYRFPQSELNTTGAGPDFPGSSGDRERGKFRPSATPRLTTVAVTGDNGEAISWHTDNLMEELLLWQKALVIGLSYQSQGGQFTVQDLLDEASQI